MVLPRLHFELVINQQPAFAFRLKESIDHPQYVRLSGTIEAHTVSQQS
jgi:hypothetical protein